MTRVGCDRAIRLGLRGASGRARGAGEPRQRPREDTWSLGSRAGGRCSGGGGARSRADAASFESRQVRRGTMGRASARDRARATGRCRRAAHVRERADRMNRAEGVSVRRATHPLHRHAASSCRLRRRDDGVPRQLDGAPTARRAVRVPRGARTLPRVRLDPWRGLGDRAQDRTDAARWARCAGARPRLG